MSYQLLLAIIGFAKEFFKYLNERERRGAEYAAKVKGLTSAIKASKNSKDTSGIEAAFRDITADISDK